MLLAQQFHDFLIRAGSSRTAKTSLASLADAASITKATAPAKSRDAGDHDGA